MLLFKLKELECLLEKDEKTDGSALNIVLALINTLQHIDFRTEVIPEYSYDKIIQVLEDVNGKVLSIEEKKVIRAVISNQEDL